MRRTPSGASARSFTSYRFVVAIQSFRSCYAARRRSCLRCSHSSALSLPASQVWTASRSPGSRRSLRGERDVGELDAEAGAQLAQRAELVQLADAVHAVAARPPRGNDESCVLEIAEHPGRPARLPCRRADGQLHRRNLTTFTSRFARALAAVGVLEPDDVVEVGGRDLENPRVLDAGHAVDRARPEAERLARRDLDLLRRLPPRRGPAPASPAPRARTTTRP